MEEFKDNGFEVFPLVDECGNVIGKASREECHNGSKLLHPVVHLHLFDSEGRLYLQRRPLWKDIQPGKWDTSVGGHVDYGENVISALHREAHEELGVADFEEKLMATYVFESSVEREYVNSFYTVTDQPVNPTNELNGGKFWSVKEILDNIGKDVFTPNFEKEFTAIVHRQFRNLFHSKI
ncbi:MAG: NUDIX domain-containing protein [Duncaniella sp.]|nr:NUDIX domain-containing protein [Muribaculum sp.]MCM1255511.1 NUDIX domain-containing protein [Duncaniella sp.]